MNMLKTMGIAGLALALSRAPVVAAPIRIVTTTPTFADIARRIGGKHVRVQSLMKGKEDVHNVPPKPSFVVKLRRADLFVHAGLDAEPWVPQLLRTGRNRRLLPGGEGYVDCSQGIELLEVPPRGALSRAQGDIHVYGNTHYMLDPLNGPICAHTIAEALKRVDPAHASDYDANLARFTQEVQALTQRLVEKMAPYAGTPIVVYHRSWPYFRRRFHLVKAGEVEPKPGLSPGPGHINQLVQTMRDTGVKVVVVEQYNPLRVARDMASRAGGVAVVLATNVKGVPGADDYFSLFETNVDRLIDAFKQAGISPASAGALSERSQP